MHKFLRGRGWVAGLLLAAGCRSEQAAFSFRPTAQPVSLAVAAAPVPLMAAAAVSALPAISLPAAVATSAPGAPASVAAPVRARPHSQLPKRVAAKRWQPTSGHTSRHETASQTNRTDRADTLHLVLGGVLVAAGVVGGILLGGWLGLGVGAALVLLGYYFGLMGLGGRQAWLEVFQEFFNM